MVCSQKQLENNRFLGTVMKITAHGLAIITLAFLAGCLETTAPSSNAPAAVAGTKTPVGRTPSGGSFKVESGSEVIIYGVRGPSCGLPVPDFNVVMTEFSKLPSEGTLYDAGVGRRNSVGCGRVVPVRAIGYLSPPDGFSGKFTIVSYCSDRATVRAVVSDG